MSYATHKPDCNYPEFIRELNYNDFKSYHNCDISLLSVDEKMSIKQDSAFIIKEIQLNICPECGVALHRDVNPDLFTGLKVTEYMELNGCSRELVQGVLNLLESGTLKSISTTNLIKSAFDESEDDDFLKDDIKEKEYILKILSDAIAGLEKYRK